jgi:hypothetical protein
MTTNNLSGQKLDEIQRRIAELSESIPLERINGVIESFSFFHDAMAWDTPRPDDADFATAFDLTLNLFDSPGGNPEKLDHHVVPLDGNYEGRGVVVEGCHGDGKFHCHYYDKLPWVTMTAAEIEAQAAKEEGSPK